MLTKSDLQSLLQCPRKLWLERNRPELAPAPDSAWSRRSLDGRDVGKKARQQLGENFLWPPGQADHAVAAENARALLEESPNTPAAEFPMVRDGLYARADALIPVDGGFVLRETKASTFPLKADKATPASPKDYHVMDVAIQAWALEGTGLPMQGAELNLIDSRWQYTGDGDYRGLFRQMDVRSQAESRMSEIPALVAQANDVLGNSMPDLPTGAQCATPYPCPFLAFCEQTNPTAEEHPLEVLPGSGGKALARKLRERGYRTLLEPRPDEFTGKEAELYRRMQDAHRSGEGILAPGSKEKLAALAYPRYFFDFEGIDLPIPRWSGVRPYEQVPFQWSCHVERQFGVFVHEEFLDLTGDDPSLPCIERMLATIPDDGGPILVYSRTYEAGVLEKLAKRHPQHAAALQRYIDRLVDLLPIVKDHFYHPKMLGSFSIKSVLPIVAPDLDYGALDEVQEGTAAQVSYILAALEPTTAPDRKTEIEANLRRYCRQDTWAMVEIAYFLAGHSRPVRPAGM